mmetsp:Transcript_49444/g.137452  ORF Transcript_49444/g.137452 Transcript_49444/m.137452 type:complete len:201 (-) Transcript_49444:136-738(-)
MLCRRLPTERSSPLVPVGTRSSSASASASSNRSRSTSRVMQSCSMSLQRSSLAVHSESDETFPAEAIVEAAVEFEQNSSELSPRPCEVASELHSQSMSDCGKEELFFMVRSSSSLHTLPDSVWFRSSPQMVVGSVHPHSAILCMRRSSWLAGMVLSNWFTRDTRPVAGDSTSFQSSRAGKLQGSPICSCTRPPTHARKAG